VKIAELNTLTVEEVHGKQIVLDGGPLGLIDWKGLYPGKTPSPGDAVEGYLYSDPEGYLYLCRQELPFAHLGLYKVTIDSLHPEGALVDWKRPQPLLIPRTEQTETLELGQEIFMLFVVDQEKELCYGTTRYEKYLPAALEGVEIGKSVNAQALDQTANGYRFLLDSGGVAFMYKNEAMGPVEPGKRYTLNIKWVRPDGKIDLTQQPLGYENRVPVAADRLASLLSDNGGFLPLNDDSHAEDIQHRTGMSKKLFKMAVGRLLKERKIEIKGEGIRWIP
jgi:uncharacterized protein